MRPCAYHSTVPGLKLEASWPASEDGTATGCIVACFKGGTQFCSVGTPIINIGNGLSSATCEASDIFAVPSITDPESWDIYVSGGFRGEVLHKAGGAEPSVCTSSLASCGFIGLLSLDRDFTMTMENFDFIRAADSTSELHSVIGRLSPSVFGVWLSGVISGGLSLCAVMYPDLRSSGSLD